MYNDIFVLLYVCKICMIFHSVENNNYLFEMLIWTNAIFQILRKVWYLEKFLFVLIWF